MNVRTVAALSGICLLIAVVVASAQATNDVTFKIPVNLTRLSQELTQVNITCEISSSRLPDRKPVFSGVLLPVVNGQVVTTATFVAAVPPLTYSPSTGGTAAYECTIFGVDGQSRAHLFQQDSPDPVARVSPTPAPLRGSFLWEQ